MSERPHSDGQRLEDAFFLRNDARLIEQRRKLEKLARTQAALAEVSGIRNPQVLARLVELQVTPDLLATLAVVPLVEVAWADGQVHERERAAALAGAEGTGVARGSVNHVLLEEWLQQRPTPELLEAWNHYVAGLCESLTAAEREALREDLLARARRVAEAAGGFLGLGAKVSEQEQAVLDSMAAAFDRPRD
ncbi:MAG: hypothetical protein AB1505_07045 [Candidatus Latescibacterota bacterium]